MDEKTRLREELFAQYFIDDEDRIEITKLLDNIDPYIKIWEGLHSILERNLKRFCSFDEIDEVKILEYQNVKYLIIKFGIWNYLIIDLESKKCLDRNSISQKFNVSFFIDYFGECSSDDLGIFSFFKCYAIEEIIDFCTQHYEVLSISHHIYCRFDIGNAFTYFSLDFASKSGQLVFQTSDQFLYDHLHFDIYLNPWGMQDCVEKIGFERLNEMFYELKNIKIPIRCVPREFLSDDYTRNRKI